jgi:hypothetical protein
VKPFIVAFIDLINLFGIPKKDIPYNEAAHSVLVLS